MRKKTEAYVATIKHDNGTIKFLVISLNGKEGAKQQVTAMENCPESAIVDLVKVNIDTNKNQ